MSRFLLTRTLAVLLGVGALVGVGGVLLGERVPLAELVGWGLLSAVAITATGAALWWIGRRFLWRVGRRLAFSYFLIGVLPIPMVLLVAGLALYLLAGGLMGHVFRAEAEHLAERLDERADAALAGAPLGDPNLGLARYRDGRRVAGGEPTDNAFPTAWPEWADAADGGLRYALTGDGQITILGIAGNARDGVVVRFLGDVGEELSRRSGIWVSLLLPEDRGRESNLQIQILGREYWLGTPQGRNTLERRDQVLGNDPKADFSVWSSPWLWWGELAAVPLRDLTSGAEARDFVAVSLNSSPNGLRKLLSSPSAEINAAGWIALISVSGLLSTVYVAAVVMALFMIFGLSRAVDRLSTATEAIRAGRFETRIPGRRRDQVGELQGSVNHLAADLERLVEGEAAKEVLEKELRIARDLQQSLLPSDLPSTERVEFTTLFEPSAAIGGDYFDVLRVDADRIAVAIADVSGHGLPSGLRMAMLKAALVILVEEGRPPDEILRRLHAMVRAEGRRRFFITATVALLDFRLSTLEITNAGHPPTYLLRRGEVEEILLPGSALGALGENYGRRTVDLEPGDTVVWLSDGLIEAMDADGDPFGYDRLREALRGDGDPTATRARLVEAVERHTAGRPIGDDRTVVVMRYRSAEA